MIVMGMYDHPPFYLSAYGIAVKHGFVGTEAQWLASLKGEKGDGLVILGSYATLEELEAAYPDGAPDGFFRVGEDPNALLYYWGKEEKAWLSLDLRGQPGADGVSPTATVTEIAGGHRITITDAEGTCSFDVMDGETPRISVEELPGGRHVIRIESGGEGTVVTLQDGYDGVSPTVSIMEFTGGHRVTITDRQHPQGQSFDVLDGEEGGSGVFWATYGETTAAEIVAAVTAGKTALCRIGGEVYYCVYALNRICEFISAPEDLDGVVIDRLVVTDQVSQSGGETTVTPEWSRTSEALGDYEALANKPSLNGITIEGDHDSAYYGVDQTYTHTQSVASSTWTIVHNLNKFPSVTVVDTAGFHVIGDLQYVDSNTVICSFSSAFGGTAYLN